MKIPVRAPRANAYAERFVGTLSRECLDHLLIVGERHLRGVLASYRKHYNEHRPHQGRRHLPPNYRVDQVIDVTARIRRRHVVGGLINEYHRAATVRARPAERNAKGFGTAHARAELVERGLEVSDVRPFDGAVRVDGRG